MTRRKTLRTLFLAAMTSLGLCRPAKSSLLIELQVTSVSGPAIINSPQSVLVTGPGARIEMDIWAYMFFAVTQGDGLVHVGGSLTSYGSDIRGPLTAHRDSLFQGPGSSDGEQRDYDGDGDLDIAGPNDADPAGFFLARSIAFPSPPPGPFVEVKIGTASFLVDQLGSTEAITVLFFRPGPFSDAASWMENGQLRTTPVWGQHPVTVSAVPEPAALGLLAAVATFAAALRPQKRH